MIDVSRFNWTGPRIDPTTGKLQHLETADFVKAMATGMPNGYELYTGTDEYGAFIGFRAASGLSDSGTTPNTDYPRSETRETLANGDDKEANWKASASEVHGMRAKARIVSLATSKKAIIGQIHGEGNHPPLKIQVTGTTAYAQLRKGLNSSEDKPAIGTIEVGGAPFTYDYRVYKDYSADIWFNGELKVSKYQFDATSYKNDTWYNKAGMYSQEDALSGSGVGDIRFYQLELYTALPVVTPPVVTPPVVVPPVVVPPVVTPPAARTLANVSADVAAQLNIWRTDHGQVKAVEAAIQVLKTEADTFPKGDERSAVYTAITAARTEIRAVPPVVVDPPVDTSLSGQIATIVKANAAGTMTLSAAKAKLNTIGDQIDEMDDGAEQTALYAQLKAATTGLK